MGNRLPGSTTTLAGAMAQPPAPTSPSMAKGQGASPDSAKMAGTKIQKKAAQLAQTRGEDRSKHLSQQQRLEQDRTERTETEELATRRASQLGQFGSLGSRIQEIIQSQLSAGLEASAESSKLAMSEEEARIEAEEKAAAKEAMAAGGLMMGDSYSIQLNDDGSIKRDENGIAIPGQETPIKYDNTIQIADGDALGAEFDNLSDADQGLALQYINRFYNGEGDHWLGKLQDLGLLPLEGMNEQGIAALVGGIEKATGDSVASMISDNLTIADLTQEQLADMGLENIDELAAALGVSKEEAVQMPLSDIIGIIEREQGVSFSKAEKIREQLADETISESEKEMLREQLRDLGGVGITGVEEDVKSLANDIRDASTITINGEDMSLEEFLKDENFSAQVVKYFSEAVTDEERAELEAILGEDNIAMLGEHRETIKKVLKARGAEAEEYGRLEGGRRDALSQLEGVDQEVIDMLFSELGERGRDVTSVLGQTAYKAFTDKADTDSMMQFVFGGSSSRRVESALSALYKNSKGRDVGVEDYSAKYRPLMDLLDKRPRDGEVDDGISINERLRALTPEDIRALKKLQSEFRKDSKTLKDANKAKSKADYYEETTKVFWEKVPSVLDVYNQNPRALGIGKNALEDLLESRGLDLREVLGEHVSPWNLKRFLLAEKAWQDRATGQGRSLNQQNARWDDKWAVRLRKALGIAPKEGWKDGMSTTISSTGGGRIIQGGEQVAPYRK